MTRGDCFVIFVPDFNFYIYQLFYRDNIRHGNAHKTIRILKKMTAIALLLWANISLAQETGEENLGTWLFLNVKSQLTEKFSTNLVLQKRFYEFLENEQNLIGQVALNYNFWKKTTASVGYSYIESEPFLKPDNFSTTYENRIYEQFSLNDHLKKLQINQQFRLEQRWINRSGNTDFESRFRTRLWLRFPINHKAIVPKTIFLSSFDEIMFNLQGDAFNQNRAFGGLGYQIDKNFRFEAGYMKNSFKEKNFDRIWLMLFINTDLRKVFKKQPQKTDS